MFICFNTMTLFYEKLWELSEKARALKLNYHIYSLFWYYITQCKLNAGYDDLMQGIQISE